MTTNTTTRFDLAGKQPAALLRAEVTRALAPLRAAYGLDVRVGVYEHDRDGANATLSIMFASSVGEVSDGE